MGGTVLGALCSPHADPTEGPKQVGTEGWTHHMTTDHDHDVVVDNRGSGIGAILGVIVILALVAGIWYFAFGPGQGTFGGESTQNGTDINVDVELPSVEPAAS